MKSNAAIFCKSDFLVFLLYYQKPHFHEMTIAKVTKKDAVICVHSYQIKSEVELVE